MKQHVREAIEKTEKILEAEGISALVSAYEDISAFTVEINWGDWKHEHARAKYIIESNGIGKLVKSETTEEDGSDTYSAIHYFIVMG